MWSNILAFGKIGCAWILRWIQIAHCHCDPVRCAGVIVASMIVRARWERAGEGIHPGTGTQAGLMYDSNWSRKCRSNLGRAVSRCNRGCSRGRKHFLSKTQ